MSIQFFSKLSQNYIELLEDDEYYDITIEVGEEPNVKIIRAHMNILCHRSPYLRRALATKKASKNNVIVHINLPEISPEVFQIILKYIYGGILSLNHQNNLDILKLLSAADELLLQEVVEYLQAYLIEYKSEWMEQHFELIHRTSFQSNSLLELQQFFHPYKKLLNHQLYKNLLNSHLDPDSEPTDDILLPRSIKIYGIIDSKIGNNLNIISTISRRIDKMVINNKFDHLRELYLPYKFQLLLRGSRDGFTPKIFHELCDNKPNTVIFIKVKRTEEILGGYNPIIWKSHGSGLWAKTKDSFIFSFKNNNVKDGIISDIEDTDRALWYNSSAGPFFGYDIIIYAHNSLHYNDIRYEQHYYEKKIRNEGQFGIEDFEVFQIIKK
ncbi:BTB/POZ protein [Rhizophagus clarus]|uniref:BTB/POZ protein n=1 Tax=Rhizophagus clarus TaxID=94130 RepID=A0A8H3LWB1_9GLOM|nr:BTB/POZ protein [Rhizophagus clarus]